MYKKRSNTKTRKSGIKKSVRRYNKSKPKPKSGIENKHYAQITETIELADLVSKTNNQEYFTLGTFKRALGISENFKFYRAKKVLFKYEPIYNVYGEGSTSDTIPYMYTVMNRDQDNNLTYTKADFQRMGALPYKFTATKIVQYTPNWICPGMQAFKTTTLTSGEKVVSNIVQQGVTKCYKWLQTTDNSGNAYSENQIIQTGGMDTLTYQIPNNFASQVLYNGHNVYFDQNIVGDLATVAKRTITVVWEFKGAKVRVPPSTGSNVTVQV